MTVGELMHILGDVDPERMVYVPDTDGRAEMLAAVVDLRHTNALKGVRIPDDVALLPASMIEPLDDRTDGRA